MGNLYLFDFKENNTRRKYLSYRKYIGKYIGFNNLTKIENYFPNQVLLLELCKSKKLMLASKALEITNIYDDECEIQFFYNLRSFLPNFLTKQYIKIRDEVYQYIGFDLIIKLEENPNFQHLCVYLHRRQDLFLENMIFLKKFVTSSIFNESADPFSLEILKFLLYDIGHLILNKNIFEQNFSLDKLNSISAFLIENNLTDEKSLKTAIFIYNILNSCSKEDLQKIYKYKSAWEKSYEYCQDFNTSVLNIKPIFTSTTKFILFFRTLNHYWSFNKNIIYLLIISNSIDILKINEYPYCYAKELNNFYK